TRPVMPEIFIPYNQSRSAAMIRNMSLIVRAGSDPATMASAIRQEVMAVDPNQPVYNVQTMEKVISESFSDRRLNMMLLSIFAGVALILAMVGIYSVMSYTVAQATREIGIRMALGARAVDVLKLIVGRGLGLALVGVILGVAGAFALTRFLSSLLFGVTSTDPLTFIVVSGLLLLVAIVSSYLPARRATRVDPMRALRYE
ncbi:MAG TPA: FtsX-like permease family protein, partial [Blastocatellia bacterium]|nr:FtsX-like permease family protein [Blastocatellia bacterium]